MSEEKKNEQESLPKQEQEQAREKQLEEQEKIKNPESFEDLENKALAEKEEVAESYEQSKRAVVSLAQSEIITESQGPEKEQLVSEVKELEAEAIAKTETTEKKLEETAKIFKETNFDFNRPELKKTKFENASEKQQKKFDEKIRPEMQQAIGTVCGRAFNKRCQLPYCLIGSNCYVPNAETKKVTDDLDIVFDINDFDAVKEEFEKMATEGLIYMKEVNEETKEAKYLPGFKVSNLKNWEGEENGCRKINCYIKVKNKEGQDVLVEMEAFGQNGDENKKNAQGETIKNGIININLEETSVNRYHTKEGIEVIIAGKETAEKLYQANARNEAGLLDMKGHKIKNFLSFKYLQRQLNLENLEKGKYEEGEMPSQEEIIDKVIKSLDQEGYRTPVAEYGIKLVKQSWENYKQEDMEGPGLVNTLVEEIIEEKKLGLSVSEYKNQDPQYKEDVVERMTRMVQTDLKILSEYHVLESKLDKAISEKASEEEKKNASEELLQLAKKLRELENKYDAYSASIRNRKKNEQGEKILDAEDFSVSPAVTELSTKFIRPAIASLLHYKIELKN